MSGVGRGGEKIPGNTRAAGRLALFCARGRHVQAAGGSEDGGGLLAAVRYIDANVGGERR